MFVFLVVVFGDQASVNMQEMALMQAGRGTGKGYWEGVKLIFVFSVTFR